MNNTIRTSGSRAKVLIVDDTPANLRLLARTLAARDYFVFAANSGELALQFLETTVPDIILLDVNMPILDGYEVCQRLKASERTRDVPVIFVSAMDAAWDKVKAFAVGGVDYIVKPIDEVEVLARLETHLSLHMLRQQLEQKVEARTSEALRSRAALQTNQILLKSIIDSSTAIIYAKNLDGHYILVNNQFQELFGDPGADLLGLTDQDVFDPEVAEQMRKFDRQVISSGTSVETEEAFFHQGERRTYISVRYPLRDVDGRIYAVCCIATDISERVLQETTLRRLNEMLEKRLSERQRDGSPGNSPTLAD